MTEEVKSNDGDVVVIESIWTGECPSLTGRSSLIFAIGRHPADASLGLRIVANSGGGMFCDEWAEGRRIDEIVRGKSELIAQSFSVLHPGRSVNTGGFVLAVLKHLGLLRISSENSRLHEHIPSTTFEQLALSAMSQASSDIGSGRKTLKLKKGVN
jgi:hypothetical protein